MNQIINKDHILDCSILNNSKILDKESIVSLHAVLSVQNPMYSFAFLIQVLNYRLSIVWCRGCENVYGIKLRHFLQELQTVGPDVEIKLIPFYWKAYVRFLRVENWVNQGLV